MSYRVVEEDERGFLVDDGGRQFRVARKGLSEPVIARIQALAMGGRVKSYAEGGMVGDEVLPLELPAAAPAPTPPAALVRPPSVLAPETPLPTGEDANLAGGVAGVLGDLDESFARVRESRRQEALARLESRKDGRPEDQKDSDKVPLFEAFKRADTAAMEPEPVVPAIEAQPAQLDSDLFAGIESSAPTGVSVRQPGEIEVDPGIDAGLRQRQEALQRQGEAEAARAAAEAQAQADRAARLEAARGEFDATMAEHTQRREALREDIANAKINPNRLFHDMSTGQKIGAVISMALSGLGQSLSAAAGQSGQPNMAMTVLDQMVERDIAAQRADLGKKQSLLADYVQQGRDMQSAYQMTKADLLDVSAAKIAEAAAKTAGEVAKAQLMERAGALEMQAVGLRQEAESRAIANKYNPMIHEGQLAMQRASLSATQRQSRMQGAANAVEAALVQGKSVPREVMHLVPDKMRDTLIQLPTGQFVAATSGEGAKKIRQSQEAAGEILAAISEMRDLNREVSGETLPTEASAKSKSLQMQVVTRLNKLGGLGALDVKTLELLQQMVPDATAQLTTDWRVQARLRELERQVNGSVRSMLNANLFAEQRPVSVER